MTSMISNFKHTDSFGKNGRSLEDEESAIKKLLDYIHVDVNIGKIWWAVDVSNKCKSGMEIGCLDKRGYCVVGFNREYFKRHRIIFYVAKGYLPLLIDHKHGVEAGDGIENLQEATCSENTQKRKKLSNNKSGYVGVSWNKSKAKWVSSLTFRKKHIFLGYFDDPLHASMAREEKAKELYKNFYNKDA